MLGTSAIALTALKRAMDTSKGLINIPVILLTSFLKGISKAVSDKEALDGNILAITEEVIAQNTTIMGQIKKDFNDAYKIQEEKFIENLERFKNSSDRAQDFLFLPKKANLALDRSARALFWREFKDSKINKLLNHIDILGHSYSAATSVLLANIYRVGEFCGQFAGEYSKSLGNMVTDPINLYFFACFLSVDILSSPLGKTLGFDKIAKLLLPILNYLPEKLASLTPKTPKISKTVNGWLWNIPKKVLKAHEWIVGPLDKGSIPFNLTGIRQHINPKALFLVSSAIQTVLAAKTYVLAPMLAGICDGLTTEPTLEEFIQTSEKIAPEIPLKDQKNFLARTWEEFKIAQKKALNSFAKYDKYFEKAEDKSKKYSPEVEMLKKKPFLVINLKIGRAQVLSLHKEKNILKYTPTVLNWFDQIKAGIQATASLTAVTSYRAGKYIVNILPIKKQSHVDKLRKSRYNNKSNRIL